MAVEGGRVLMDEGTAKDHIEDLMEEVSKLRNELRELEKDRDGWKQLADSLADGVRDAHNDNGWMIAVDALATYDNKVNPEPSMRDRLLDSLGFVVDMMNSGKVNARDVYPPGRYQGD
jgi:hypothetical protein